jgi:cytoskeletal protein CcmA (bactofilin family)
MFSSKVKETAPAPQPLNAAAAPAKRPARPDAPSIISADLVVNGALTSSGDMQIDGKVEGDVRSAGLVIGEKAEIHGEIFAEDLTVRGKVIGRIRARKVQLCSTSHVEGDILHEAFAVEAGAFFEGNIRHSDNPLGESAEKKKVTGPQPVVMQPPPAVAQNIMTPPPAMPPRTMANVATLAPLGSAS